METTAYLRSLREDIVFTFNFLGHELTFHSTWGLFSPREVDEGTRLLLRHLELGPADDCLDIGCGYGPIGLAMATLAPQGQTLMVDRDFVAIDYAHKNILVNRLTNAEVLMSNGFSHIGTRSFDVVASNIPAKAGKELYHLLLHDAFEHLKPDGGFYVVTVNGLRQFIKRNFNEVFGNYTKIKQGQNYTVAMARKL